MRIKHNSSQGTDVWQKEKNKLLQMLWFIDIFEKDFSKAHT